MKPIKKFDTDFSYLVEDIMNTKICETHGQKCPLTVIILLSLKSIKLHILQTIDKRLVKMVAYGNIETFPIVYSSVPELILYQI